jgi:hypothetical protein
MTNAFQISLALSALMVLFCILVALVRHFQHPVRWEYALYVEDSQEAVQERLRFEGERGWEMVTLTAFIGGKTLTTDHRRLLILKRRY